MTSWATCEQSVRFRQGRIAGSSSCGCLLVLVPPPQANQATGEHVIEKLTALRKLRSESFTCITPSTTNLRVGKTDCQADCFAPQSRPVERQTKLALVISMPLTPQHTWEETGATISVVITAPGLTKAKSDLLICDNFVRLNCPPYLLQLDLAHQVDDANGSAVFGPGGVTFRLNKVSKERLHQVSHCCMLRLSADACQVEQILWGQLTAQGTKQDLQERRQTAQQRLGLRLESNKQAQLDQRKALDK